MDLHTLQRLVSQGEGQRLEFKRKLPESEKLSREVVALANSEGGILLLGVDDDGTLTGLKDSEETAEAFDQAIQKHCRPMIEYRMELIPLSRKRNVIAVHIPESTIKPHRLFHEDKGTTLIRIKDQSVVASKEVYYILRYQGKDQDVKVEYGEKERALMRYLEEHGSITKESFRQIARISAYVASRTLVHLVRANVLRIQPGIQEDRYLPGF